MERTLILLKPDTVQRMKIGDIITNIERKGFKIVGLKMMQLDKDILKEHYSHLGDKPFFPNIVEFMSMTPVVAICIEGKDSVNQIRRLVGATDCNEAEVGTIRGNLGNSKASNMIHASDSIDNAILEIKRFFKDGELFEYDRLLDKIIFE